MQIRHRNIIGAGMGLLCVFMLAGQVAYGADMVETTGGSDYTDALARLGRHLARQGFDADRLFANPAFAIDETIRDRFTKSPEATGIKKVIDAGEADDPAHKERVFQQEFTRYKRHIGFDGKQQKIVPFFSQYREQLLASEQEYGIPAEVIAAIIGIESDFGAVTGRHYAFNVYVSMYVVGYRSDFALSQLEELLAFADKKDMDVFAVKSSYAGAMGYMQFIPYSLNHWFVGDDLYDMEDTIASVANYLAHFHERRGSIERAVFSYNPSRLYTETVLELAEYAKTQRESL